MLNSAGFYIVLLMGWAVYAIVVVWRVPGNVCLGAVVPEEKRHDPKCRRLERCYYWGVTLSAIVMILLIWILHIKPQKTELQFDIMVSECMRMGMILLVYCYCTHLYLSYHRKQMLKCVRVENWLPDREDGTIVVDTTFHQKRKSISPFWLLLFPLVIVGTLVVYAIFRPELYSGRFDDTFAEFKWNDQYQFTTIGFTSLKNAIIASQVYFAFIAVIIFYGYATARQALDPKDPGGSLEKELKRRKFLQVCYLVVYIAACLVYTSIPFIALNSYKLGTFCFFSLPLVLVVLGLTMFFTVQTGSIEARKNVPGNLPATMFYNDPDDSALFIGNRSGLGILMNWSHPRGKILTTGFVLLLPVLLAFFCYFAPVTNFLPRYDISQSRQQNVRAGTRLFVDAVLASESQRERIGEISVKGTIELLKFSQKDGEEPFSRGDTKNAMRGYIDGKRSLETLGGMFQVETVRTDKVLFANVRSYVVNQDQQSLRELTKTQGKAPDKTLLPRSDDGYLVAYEQATHDYLREYYKGFDFFRMGQVQGKLVDAFRREVNNIGPMLLGGDPVAAREWNVQQFIDEAAILSEYHGFVILSSGERLATPPPPPDITRLWSASMVLPNQRGYSLRNEILLKPAQNYIAPKCQYNSDAGKFEANLSSEYFTPTPNAWLPKQYTAIYVDVSDDASTANDGGFAQAVRVTLEPNTAQVRRYFRE